MKMEWFNNEACIEGIYPLAESCSSEIVPEWLDDFCMWIDDDTTRNMAACVPNLKSLLEDDDYMPSADEVCEALQYPPPNGFFVKVRWCKRQYMEGGTFVSGPRLTRFEWVYGQTLEQAMKAAYQIVISDHAKNEAAVA